jgi:peroxiredoxin
MIGLMPHGRSFLIDFAEVWGNHYGFILGLRGLPEEIAMKRAVAVLAVSTLLLFVLTPVLSPVQASDFDFGAEKFKVGDKAPDFTLKNLDGQSVSLSSFAGDKPVLLAFFALRCGTCLMEAPYLETLHKKYAGQAAFLAINTDGVDAKIAAETMGEVGFVFTFPVLVDTEFQVTDVYTNFVVPLTLVIDRGGIIRYIHTSFEEGIEKEYEEALKKALNS